MTTPLRPLRILFVDDEPRLLDALRRSMHAERHRWHSRFASSGAEALAELERETADVVICDMRMPVMDGAALLALVAHRHPHAVRIVLSGQAEEYTGVHPSRVAHRFLSKPLPTAVLRDTIEQVHEACNRLPDRGRRAMANSELLPVTHAAYSRVAHALRTSSASVRTVARCVETDAALTATVLHLAHAAFFGQSTVGTSVEEALRCIDLDVFRTLMDGEEMRRAATPRLQPRVDAEHRRSITAARIAARIAPNALSNDAYIAALLGGLGALLLAACDEPHDDADAASLTAYLLGIWGLTAVLHPGGSAGVQHRPSVRCLVANARALAATQDTDRIGRACCAIAELEWMADEVAVA